MHAKEISKLSTVVAFSFISEMDCYKKLFPLLVSSFTFVQFFDFRVSIYLFECEICFEVNFRIYLYACPAVLHGLSSGESLERSQQVNKISSIRHILER